MSRIDTPEGSFFDRQFHLGTPSGELRAALDRARAEGFLLSYDLQGQELAIRRPWLEGSDLRQLFRGHGSAEWMELSIEVFNGLWRFLEKLEPFGHGAVHPGNVLVGVDDLHLVDAVANPLWLGLEATSMEAPVWTWGRRVPSGWSMADWDLVHLVRLVVLLSLGPEGWEPGQSDRAVLDHSRTWLAAAGAQTIGDTLKVVLRAEALLARLPLPPPLPSGDVWLQQQLKELAAREPLRRLLRDAERTRLLKQAAAQGMKEAQAAHWMDVWLKVRGWKSEAELQRQVQVLLEGGLQPGSADRLKLVSRNATDSARRLLARHGMADAEADRLVSAVLGRRGWTAETSLESKWQPLVAEYVQKNCPNRQYRRNHFEEMVERVTSFGLPRRLAERGVQQLLSQWGYKSELP